MKVQDHLKTDNLEKLEKIRKKKEEFSKRDMEELINLHMQTLRLGHGGAKKRLS